MFNQTRIMLQNINDWQQHRVRRRKSGLPKCLVRFSTNSRIRVFSECTTSYVQDANQWCSWCGVSKQHHHDKCRNQQRVLCSQLHNWFNTNTGTRYNLRMHFHETFNMRRNSQELLSRNKLSRVESHTNNGQSESHDFKDKGLKHRNQ